MAASQTPSEWHRSPSVGITPITVRSARYGKQIVKKTDLILSSTARPSLTAPATVGAASAATTGTGAMMGIVDRICSVCVRCSAGYSCPRCLVAYCSSKCYKVHGSGCTEAFFREHVKRETKLRDAEEQSEYPRRRSIPQQPHKCSPSGSISTSTTSTTGGNPTTVEAAAGTGAGVGGAQERRAQMVEVLRRLRHSSNNRHEGTNTSKNMSSPASSLLSSFSSTEGDDCWCKGSATRVHPNAIAGGEERDNDGALPAILPDKRLEALAQALGAFDLSGAGAAIAPKTSPPARDGGVVAGGEGAEEARRGEGWAGARPAAAAGSYDGDSGTIAERDGCGVMDLLTEDERSRFLREVASGRLGKLIVPWVPWWTHLAGIQEVPRDCYPGDAEGASTAAVAKQSSVAPSKNHNNLASANFSNVTSVTSESCSLVSSASTEPPTPDAHKVSSSFASSSDTPHLRAKPGLSKRNPNVLVAAASPSPTPSFPQSVVSAMNSGFYSQDSGGGDEACCARHTFAALMANVRRAPDFSTLSAAAPSPALPALAIDLAFAYVLVARLYNGCWCDDPVGAALALVGASPVLRDAATPRSVAEALSACVERAVEGEGVHSRGYAESLRKDVLTLCEDHRKLTCAFQDAWMMTDAAGKLLAPPNNSATAVNGGKKDNTITAASGKGKDKSQKKKAARELGRVGKRVGYFLLWARSHGADATPAMAADIVTAGINVAGGGDRDAASWNISV